jgi:hypothetical protein
VDTTATTVQSVARFHMFLRTKDRYIDKMFVYNRVKSKLQGAKSFLRSYFLLTWSIFSRLLLWKPNFHKFVIMLTKACHLTQINPFLVPTVCLCNIKFIFLQSNLELPSRIWSFRVLRPVRCAFISSPAYYMHRESHLFLYDHTNKASQYTSFATL